MAIYGAEKKQQLWLCIQLSRNRCKESGEETAAMVVESLCSYM